MQSQILTIFFCLLCMSNGIHGIKTCTCQNGVQATGTACTTNGANICTSCHSFYHKTGNTCTRNVCTCQNGVQATGTACTTNGANICTSCNDNYSLIGEGTNAAKCSKICTLQEGTTDYEPYAEHLVDKVYFATTSEGMEIGRGLSVEGFSKAPLQINFKENPPTFGIPIVKQYVEVGNAAQDVTSMVDACAKVGGQPIETEEECRVAFEDNKDIWIQELRDTNNYYDDKSFAYIGIHSSPYKAQGCIKSGLSVMWMTSITAGYEPTSYCTNGYECVCKNHMSENVPFPVMCGDSLCDLTTKYQTPYERCELFAAMWCSKNEGCRDDLLLRDDILWPAFAFLGTDDTTMTTRTNYIGAYQWPGVIGDGQKPRLTRAEKDPTITTVMTTNPTISAVNSGWNKEDVYAHNLVYGGARHPNGCIILNHGGIHKIRWNQDHVTAKVFSQSNDGLSKYKNAHGTQHSIENDFCPYDVKRPHWGISIEAWARKHKSGVCPTNYAFDPTTRTCNDGCPIGQSRYESPNNAQCLDCEVGRYKGIINGLSKCHNCPDGQYQNDSGQTSCESCASGQYQVQSGQSSCKTCASGQYQDQSGQSSCKTCGTGKYNGQQGQTTESSCKTCASGQYQDETGQSSCKTFACVKEQCFLTSGPSAWRPVSYENNYYIDHQKQGCAKNIVTSEDCTNAALQLVGNGLLGSLGSPHTLIKSGVECGSADVQIGTFATLAECTDACRTQVGCVFFVYGVGVNNRCYWEKTNSAACTEVFVVNDYNFYQLGPLHTLIKSDVECNSESVLLGSVSTVTECADKCRLKVGCNFFIYGNWVDTGSNPRRCYEETTDSAVCTEGFKTNSYDFYQLSPLYYSSETYECLSGDTTICDGASPGGAKNDHETNWLCSDGFFRDYPYCRTCPHGKSMPVPIHAYSHCFDTKDAIETGKYNLDIRSTLPYAEKPICSGDHYVDIHMVSTDTGHPKTDVGLTTYTNEGISNVEANGCSNNWKSNQECVDKCTTEVNCKGVYVYTSNHFAGPTGLGRCCLKKSFNVDAGFNGASATAGTWYEKLPPKCTSCETGKFIGAVAHNYNSCVNNGVSVKTSKYCSYNTKYKDADMNKEKCFAEGNLLTELTSEIKEDRPKGCSVAGYFISQTPCETPIQSASECVTAFDALSPQLNSDHSKVNTLGCANACGLPGPNFPPACYIRFPDNQWFYNGDHSSTDCLNGCVCKGGVNWNSEEGVGRINYGDYKLLGDEGSCEKCDFPEQNGGKELHTLIKSDVECGSADVQIGTFATLAECADACRTQVGCVFFVYGVGVNNRCYWEKTNSAVCTEGFVVNDYNFYQLRQYKGLPSVILTNTGQPSVSTPMLIAPTPPILIEPESAGCSSGWTSGQTCVDACESDKDCNGVNVLTEYEVQTTRCEQMTREECGVAAAQMGTSLSDYVFSAAQKIKLPRGCYQKIDGAVFYNDGEGLEACTSDYGDADGCVCNKIRCCFKESWQTYEIKQSDNQCDVQISTEEECLTAGTQLGKTGAVKLGSWAFVPPGCSLEANDQPHFNTNTDSTTKCNGWGNGCICKEYAAKVNMYEWYEKYYTNDIKYNHHQEQQCQCTDCLKCPMGKYQDEMNGLGDVSCKICTIGRYQDESGQTSCKSCASGQYIDQSGQPSCTTCSTGQYQAQQGQSSCTTCGTGKYNEQQGQTTESSCKDCVSGQYQDQSGQSACKGCAKHSYQDQSGQSDCKTCSSGTFSEIPNGATQESDCKSCMGNLPAIYIPMLDYKVKTSGKCTDDVGYGYIETLDECTAASVGLRLNVAAASNQGWGHIPGGCVLYQIPTAGILYVNSKYGAECDGNSHCLCKRIPYKVKTSGKCTDDAGWGYIMDVKECEEAAFAFGFSDTTPHNFDGGATYPRGCFAAGVLNGLYFNQNTPNTPCDSTDKCLCKENPYKLGKCSDAGYEHISTISECEQAATALGVVDNTVMEGRDYNGNVQFGCYLGSSGLVFNSKPYIDDCVSYGECLCKSTTKYVTNYPIATQRNQLEETKQIKGEFTHAYKLKTSGICETPVINIPECENAMEIFSVVTKINQEISQADKPYGCFFSSTLELNVKSNSNTECTKDNICVCKNTIDEAQNDQSALEAQKCRDIASNVGIQFEERDFSKEKDSYDKYPCGCFYEEESFMFNNNADCNTDCRGSQYDIIDSSINGLSFDVHGISGARGCIGSGFDDVEIISRCQLCPLEFHWNSDTGQCEPNVLVCPGGNAVSGRSKITGDIKCITCNYGYGTIEENQQRCRKCEDEHYTTNDSPLSGTGSMCEQVSCDYGKGRGLQENFDELVELQDRANMFTCIDCAPGTFSDSDQTGQCQIVQPGYTVKMSFSHKMEEQVKCKPGTYSEGYYDVVLSNNESPTFEDFKCKQCLSGKFAETEASSECKNCPKGWQNDALGQSHCTKILCNFGYVVSTANTCVKCPIGTWTTVESEGICDRIKCPTGSVNPTPPNTDRCRSDTKVMVGDNMYEIIGSVENININGNEVEINLNEVNEVTVFEHSFEISDKLCDSLSDEFPTELDAKEECFKKIDCIGIEKVLNKWKLCESVDASTTGGTILQIRTEKKHTLKPKIKYSMSSVQVGMYSEYKKLLDEKDELSNTLSGYNDILTENEKTKRATKIDEKITEFEDNAQYHCEQAENELKRYTTLVSDATYGPVCTIDTIDDKTYVTLLSPPACQHVNGVESNDNICSCGFVVCPGNNYCYSKYNQCHETKIDYIAKQNSQKCEGYEVSIENKVQCDAAANAIGLCVSDCTQETELLGSDCWYDRGIDAQQEYSNVIYGAHTPDQLDLLLCKIKKCYCIHGTSANGCDGEQCTGCNDGYFLNQDFICEEHPKCIKQKTKEGTGTTTTKRICEPCDKICENSGSFKDIEGCECQCVTGFSGDSCETPAPCTQVNNEDCVNGGSLKGTFGNCYCDCPQGYSGDHCENEPVCPICQNGGVSENCACNCINGFTGANCNECGIGKGKNAAGHCEDCTYPNYNSVTTHDAACAAQNCPDGQGVTSDSATWTTTGGCELCGTGYESPAGKGQCTDIDDCASVPCQNGGICTDGLDSYSCACTAGYSGDNCENDLDNCKDDKTDVWVSEGDKNNSPYYDFYTTESCDTTKITTLSKTTTYTFRRCADATSHPFWIGLHGGQTGIIGTGQLTITTGTEDVTYECTTHPAMNSALVVVDYNPKCKNEGVCADGVCTCTDGYSDSTCTTNDNDCLSEPCQNEATCIDGVDSYTCACVTGFSGPVCDVNIDDCDTNTCSGHGTCLDGVNSYTCDCSDNWFGASCESQTNKCNGKVCNNVPITCTTIENECKCISAWHDKEGECEKNVCQCSGGEPVDECPEHNKNMCKSCTNGLLTDGNCINVCKCTNGDIADVCPQHDTNICKSCDEGFVKDESDQCVKSCVCDNGIAVEEDECPTNGVMKCKSCNTNYYLKNNTCHDHSSACTSEQYQAQEPTGEQDRICKPNKCTCVHGGAATGIDCHVDGSLCTEEAPCNICAECIKGYHNHNNICIPHVCTCDGGIEKNLEGCNDSDDPRCCHPSGEYCLTCNEGYEMTGNECKTKCTCLNGLPYAGTECLDAPAKCGSCNTGYNLENEVCVTACQCPNGVPFKGIECATTPEKCESCDVGFKEIQGATVTCETRCTCTNGEPSEGVCTQEDEHCKSCDVGFYLDDDNKCKQIVCTCANGQAHADCPNHGDEKCTSCDAGFRLDVNKCVATICTCADGTPVDNVDCNWPQTHLCASCHGGFKLDSNKHCLENICTCQNGTPARGSECEKDHEHCRYCDVGYEGSKIGEEMHCVVQNFRGDFEYHIVVNQVTNIAQISELMKVKTGFETTVVKHEFVNGKTKLHLLTRDNPIKNDGAFKTVKTLLSNTVDELQNEPHIQNIGFFGKEKKENMGPIPILIMWVVVVIILSAAIPACLIFKKKKIQSENATDSERKQLMYSKIEF